MNIFAKIISKIFNRFDAETTSFRRSALPGSLVDARFDITKFGREELMRKARFFEKNSIARRLGIVHCDFTVGANGMPFSPASKDAEWNQRAKEYLDKTLAVIDLTSRHTFGSMQQLVAWREFFDGDIFLIKTRGQDVSGKWWPRIQLVEAHLCKTPPNRMSDEGKTIVDGVEIDANGRPTGYWIQTSSDVNQFKFYDSTSVIHIFDQDRANQKRGVSKIAAAMQFLHQLSDLQELELSAARDGAEKSTFVKTANGQLPPAYSSAGKFRDTVLKSAEAATTDETRLRDAIGGRLVAIGPNDEVTQFNPARPTEATRALWDYLTSAACSVAGIPITVAFSEWVENKQGTALRADYAIAAQNFKAQSAVYAAAFREVIIYVLGWGIATEVNLADPPADWTNITYTSPRSVDVDIGRNSAARINELRVGLTSHESEYAANGLDARNEITKQIRFIAFVKKSCAEISAKEGVEVKPEEILGDILPEPMKQNQQDLIGA